MAYETVSNLDADTVISLGGKDKKTGKANPTSIEGYYLGFRVVSGTRGDSKLHVFKTAKGNVGVWGKTNLDSKLASLNLGVMTLVTFSGMKKTKNGDMYTYDVKFDRTNNTDVSGLDASNEGSGDDGGLNDNEEAPFESSSEDEGGFEDEAPAVANYDAKAAAARVQNLLNKNKKTGTR